MKFDINKAIEIVAHKLNTWLESIVAMLPNVFVAILVLLMFYIVARTTRLLSKRLLNRLSERNSINNLISSLIYILTLCIGLIISLNVLHLQQTVTSLLAGAGIVGLAIGFAFQDISANFISGVFLAFKRPIKVGDIINTKGYTGIVEQIDMRVTVIKTFQGLHVLIPNKDVFQTPVTNYTKTNERRIDLEVGISYSEDLKRVRDITLESVGNLSFLQPGKATNLYYKEFGDSSINFVIMVWVNYPDEPGFLKARSEVIIAIKSAFDKNGITIPFPIRTLDFGIQGGKQLSEMDLRLKEGEWKKAQ
jgi:small-conductance mechanosensitive channel